MTVQNEFIDINDIPDSFQEKNEPSSHNVEELNFFVSYDLCDFTKFKNSNKECRSTQKGKDIWPRVITELLKCINKSDLCSKMQLWKFNGDEFIFHTKIKTLTSIVDCIKSSYRCMRWLECELKTIFGKPECNKKPIRIKAGAWLANTTTLHYANYNADYDNAKAFYENRPTMAHNYRLIGLYTSNNEKDDFVGINMDEGFRMCSNADRGRFLVDPKIALMFHIFDEINKNPGNQNPLNLKPNYVNGSELDNFVNRCTEAVNASSADRQNISEIIKEISDFAKNLVFVGLKHCKGVWGDNNYPIIWYSCDWGALHKTPRRKDTFVVNFPSNPSGETNMDKLWNLFEEAGKKAGTVENLYKILALVEIFPAGGLLVKLK